MGTDRKGFLKGDRVRIHVLVYGIETSEDTATVVKVSRAKGLVWCDNSEVPYDLAGRWMWNGQGVGERWIVKEAHE